MTATVSEIIRGKPDPICVKNETEMREAISLMLENDFSQLPIIDDQNKVEGIITADSILRALSVLQCKISDIRVRDGSIPPVLVRPDDDVFELMRRMEDTYAAIVVDRDRRILGILTDYDTTIFFREQAEDSMLVEDIETGIKDQILHAHTGDDGRVKEQALEDTINRVIPGEKVERRGRFIHSLKIFLKASEIHVNSLAEDAVKVGLDSMFDEMPDKTLDDLSISELSRILLYDDVWVYHLASTGLNKSIIQKWLENFRKIRNDLFHFKGESGVTERETLRYAASWFTNNQPPIAADIPTVSEEDLAAIESGKPPLEQPPISKDDDGQLELIPAQEEFAPGESKYAPLATWLQKYPATENKVKLGFSQIEEIIGDRLPSSSATHRSWWANDSVGHVQSKEWLDAGWRVSSVNLNEGHVTFTRIEEQEQKYIEFYSELKQSLSSREDFPLKDSSPSGASWFVVARLSKKGPQQAVLGFSFVRRKRFRVELYIDTGDQARNKRVFDSLIANEESIQEHFDSRLTWERMNSRRASRIALYHKGSIDFSDEELGQLQEWAVQTILALKEAIWQPTLKALKR